MAGNFLNFYTVLLLSKSKASNVSEVYGNMLLKLYNGHPKCEKNAIFSIFSAVRFLATVMLLNLALRKCWKYQCQFLNVSKTKKKVKKHFYLHFMKKKCITKYRFYVRTRFRMLHIAIARYRVFTVHLENGFTTKIKISVFKVQILPFQFFFLKKKSWEHCRN